MTHAAVASLLRDAYGAAHAARCGAAGATLSPLRPPPRSGLPLGETHLGRDTAGWYLQQARGCCIVVCMLRDATNILLILPAMYWCYARSC